MTWVLVWVSLLVDGGEPVMSTAMMHGTFEMMEDCFAAREKILFEELGVTDGSPPPNNQLVCIRVE